MSNTKHLNLKDFEKSEIIGQVYAPSLMKGRGKEKLIGELDKAGKNVKTANGWVPVKGNEHLIKRGQSIAEGTMKPDVGAPYLKEEKYEWGTLRKVMFGKNGIDGVAVIHPEEWKKIMALKGGESLTFTDEQRITWDVHKEVGDAWRFVAKGLSGLKGKLDLYGSTKPTETKIEVSVHPDIQSELDNYKGGTIPSEVLIHLSAKYADKQPIETFSSVHGAPIKVYGKEGNNYAINFGGAKGITLATEADMNTMRGKKKEAVQETKQESSNQNKTFRHYERVKLLGGDSASKAELGYTGYGFIEDTNLNTYGRHKVRLEKKAGFPNLKDDIGWYTPDELGKTAAEKPTFQLSVTDGNVFSIIGKVSGALKKAGQADKAKEFTERAFKAGSYDEVLQMVHQYVNAK